MLHVEILHWSGCPSLPEARERLDAALGRAGADADIEVREVTTDAEAEELGFYGSPTILLEGRDVEPPPPHARPALTCRLYPAPGGRIAPVPSHQSLDRAIQEALTRCRS